MRPNSTSIPLNRIMEIRFLVKNITEMENIMEELWLFINEEYLPVQLMVSEETVEIHQRG